jgi:hypothetical protein
MRLTPRELERLQLFSAAELGRKPKVRGVKLNYPKAVALLCDEIIKAAQAALPAPSVVAGGGDGSRDRALRGQCAGGSACLGVRRGRGYGRWVLHHRSARRRPPLPCGVRGEQMEHRDRTRPLEGVIPLRSTS